MQVTNDRIEVLRGCVLVVKGDGSEYWDDVMVTFLVLLFTYRFW